MTETYLLQGKKPVPERNVATWMQKYFAADRHVAETTVGPYRVSTVFLGVNLSPSRHRRLLFETIIFKTARRRETSLYQEQCATWKQAEKMHERAVKHARSLLPKRRPSRSTTASS